MSASPDDPYDYEISVSQITDGITRAPTSTGMHASGLYRVPDLGETTHHRLSFDQLDLARALLTALDTDHGPAARLDELTSEFMLLLIGKFSGTSWNAWDFHEELKRFLESKEITGDWLANLGLQLATVMIVNSSRPGLTWSALRYWCVEDAS